MKEMPISMAWLRGGYVEYAAFQIGTIPKASVRPTA
jgi:hypothetical protein